MHSKGRPSRGHVGDRRPSSGVALELQSSATRTGWEAVCLWPEIPFSFPFKIRLAAEFSHFLGIHMGRCSTIYTYIRLYCHFFSAWDDDKTWITVHDMSIRDWFGESSLFCYIIDALQSLPFFSFLLFGSGSLVIRPWRTMTRIIGNPSNNSRLKVIMNHL